ncbi:hypothetical protein RUM43_008100 [Polyplax serrata]|uniref:ASCH domain-containing protein n=1 Tax=Polyplax serrata TaxID=468196 RepID=A0AAN8S5Y5_POLSC
MDASAWLNENLSDILSFPVPPCMTEYIATIENERDLEDYLKTLLDMNNPKHRSFIDKYKSIRHIGEGRSDNESDKYKGAIKKKKKGNEGKMDVKTNENDDPDGAKLGAKPKKKNKYVNLYSEEGEKKDVILLKGRHWCECQASKHKLVNNCLKCGRIVCTQEGSGPCLYCGTLVCNVDEQFILNSNTRQSEKLYENLMKKGNPNQLEQALAQRNRLLEFDKTTAQRSKVIDDESDYFSSTSSWLTKDERDRLQKKEEEAHAKKHVPRSERKYGFNLLEQKVIEEAVDSEVDENFYREALNKIEETMAESYAHPDFPAIIQPLYVYNKESGDHAGLEEKVENKKNLDYKVQDKELLLISDNGACLSMHQPWASLLVSGIKKHEGRTWYSSHRGRLWIAAASKIPTAETIKECEDFYRAISDKQLNFPTSYPTSCLLGCVSVIDCLPQEEYRVRYPDGESESPFVFVCDEPNELDIRFPMSGSHKIYKLDSRIHQAARKALLRVTKNAKC